jgi:hypothetical protein
MTDLYLTLAIVLFLFVLWCAIFLYCVSQAGKWMHRRRK